MNHHSRFHRMIALLALVALCASALGIRAALPRAQAMPALTSSSAPAAAVSSSPWVYQGPSPAFTRGTLGQDLVNVPPESEPVVGSLGGAPYSGGHDQIVASPTDPNTIYVGADGGIWKTTNATAASPTWTPLIDDKPSVLVRGLSADPTDATFQTLLAGTDRAGLYYTTNGGTSWAQIINTTIVPSGSSDGFYAVAARGSTLLVASKNGLFRTTGGVAGTWTKISGTGVLPNAAPFDIKGDPANTSRLYVSFTGASGGLFRSDDTGATWTNVSSGISIISGATNSFQIAVFNNGTTNAVFVSLNGNGTQTGTANIASATESGTTVTITTAADHGFTAGQSVTIAGVGVSGYNGTFTIASVPSTTKLTYTAASGLAASSGGTATSSITVRNLFRSLNGGTFTFLDTPTGSPSFISADKTNANLVYASGYGSSVSRVDASKASGSQVTVLGGQGSTTLSAAVTSAATTISVASTTGMPATLPFVVAVDSEQMSVTAKSGSTLTVVRGVNATTAAAHSSGASVFGYGYGEGHTDWVAFTIDANGRLLGGSHGGIYRLAAPGSPASPTNYWVSIMGNIGAFMFDAIAYDNLFNVLLGGAQDNGAPRQLAAGGLSWAHGPGGDGGDAVADNRNYAALGQSAEYRSAQSLAGFKRRIYNGPDSLVSETTIGTAVITDKRFFTPVAQNAIDPQRFVIGATGHLYETLNEFGTITSVSTFAVGSQNIAYGGYKDGIANPDVLYYGNSYYIYSRTTAGGAVTQLALPPSGSGIVKALVMDPANWMRVFIIDDKSQVYMTTNGGSSWSNITGNLVTGAGSYGGGRIVTIVPGAAGYLVAGTDGGIFASPLASLGTWSRLGTSTSLPIVSVHDVVYDATDDVLVIGTYARGAYTLSNASKELNDAPTVALSGPTTANEGTSASYSFTVSDPNAGDTFTVDSLTVGAGGSLVAGSLATTASGGSFQVSFADGPASPSISLRVKDSYSVQSNTATSTVTVSNVAPTPAILGAPTSGSVGTAVNLGSSVTDPSAADTSAGFTRSWSVTKNGSAFASGGNVSTFSYTPNAAGTYVVTLSATDQNGATGSTSATITAASPDLTENSFVVTVDEGQTATNSGTFRNGNGNALTLSSSAGTLTRADDPQTIFNDTFDSEPIGYTKTTLSQWNVTAGNIDIIGPGLDDFYPGNGRYVELAGTTNATIQTKTTFNLAPGVYRLSFELGNNSSGSGNGVTFTLGSALNDSVASTNTLTAVSRQFTVLSAVSAPLIFTQTGPVDNFGSVINDVSLVRLSPLTGTWSWSYATDDGAAQSQNVTITATDTGNAEVSSLSFALVVNNVAPTATLSNGGAVSEGSAGSVSFSAPSDPSTADTTAGFHYAYDFDNNGTFDAGDGSYAGSGAAASATVPASYLADGPGSRTVRARIIDKDGGFTDSTTTITITNAAPTASVSGPASALAGQRVTFVVGSTDPSAADQAAGFAYSIDWGDGSPTQVIARSLGNGATTASHAYAATGSKTVQVTATDKDGGASASASALITVDALTSASLQALLATTPSVFLIATSDATLQSQVAAINGLSAPASPAAITLVLGNGPYSGVTLSPPDGVVLNLAGNHTADNPGTQITGAAPAVTVTSGEVYVQGDGLSTFGDAPTILVTGGHLTIGQNAIQESTGYNNVALAVTGGEVTIGMDLLLNINGQGSFFSSYDPDAIHFPEDIDADLVPTIFQVDGNTVSATKLSATDLSSSANPSAFGQAVTFTAGIDVEADEFGEATGTVTFYEGSTVLGTGTVSEVGPDEFEASFTTSSLSTGAHTIRAVYGGNDVYIASSATLTQQVNPFSFSGFFAPVDNPPTLNQVNAGQSVPVKFSLGGNFGLGILAAGYPVSQQVACPGGAPIDDIDQTTTSPSGLTYDAASGRYTYVWKTESGWSNTCRLFTLRLIDGTDHTALFKFR